MQQANTKQELKDQAQKILADIWEIEREERRAAAFPRVGQCFKYRTSFSCPQSAADYWSIYAWITGVDENGDNTSFRFQTDVNGKIEIERAKHFPTDNWVQISQEEFKTAWRALVGEIHSFRF